MRTCLDVKIPTALLDAHRALHTRAIKWRARCAARLGRMSYHQKRTNAHTACPDAVHRERVSPRLAEPTGTVPHKF